jgi:hypothetical protein
MMKRASAIVVAIVLGGAGICSAEYVMTNQLQSDPSQIQNVQAIGGGSANATSDSDSQAVAWSEGGNATGGSANSFSQSGDSQSISVLSLSTTSVSNYKNRTAPLGTAPPYLPLWNHGGWGTVNAYFANGPTNSDKVYERTYDPENSDDMDELKGILCSLPYESPFHALNCLFNGLSVLFGGPDYYHHGRGFEIADSLVRHRRPDGKPLLVVIDSYVDPQLLTENGYAYVGRIGIEGKTERNWDQVYYAAVAEALPWDVDLLLISGGMKGVTVGSNVSFPSMAMGYSQTNYSLSLGGGYSQGITEGKGKAVLSASAYRYCPDLVEKRKVPTSLYERIRLRPKTAAAPATSTAAVAAAAAPANQAATALQRESRSEAPVKSKGPGIEISKQLYQMAGFSSNQPVDNVAVR